MLLGESTPKNIRNEATEEPSTTEEINDYLIQRRGLILSYLLKGEPPDKQYIPKPKQYQGKTLESQNEMKADLFYLGAVYTVSRSKPFQEGVDVAVTKSMVQPESHQIFQTGCWGKIFHEEITPTSGFLLQLPGSCLRLPGSCLRPLFWGPLEKYSGIEFLQIPGRTPASGSPLGNAPGPRSKVLRVRSQGPPPSSRKWKYSDKGILPYFRIWKSLTLLADQDRPTDDLHYKYRSLNLKKKV